MYPNTALSAWQLAIMAVVPVTALAAWLIAIFLAAREPRRDRAAAASAGGTARTTVASMTRAGADELEPPRAGSRPDGGLASRGPGGQPQVSGRRGVKQARLSECEA